MGRCFLCDPPAEVEDVQLMAHLVAEHDFDPEQIETWPDGDVVIHDTTLEPADFTAPREC